MPAHAIETARLTLRPLTAAAAAELHRLWTHPDVRRFLWDDQVIPPPQTASIIDTSTRLFAENGFGLWGVRWSGADALVGFGGYWFFRQPPELELLYGVAAAHWGRGVATEVARAVVRYGFEQLQFSAVRGSTDVSNAASVRVLEKAGLAFDRRGTSGGLDTVYYSLTRDRFAADETRYTLRPATTTRRTE